MKKPVMQRSMFVAVAPKSESKGIISGFDEEMENEDYENRTPENLEIIANNLRGDIRSMDERYLELAQLVGEAAFDTPEEVVALMQSQMGQQPSTSAPPTSGGIAGLGAAPAVPQQQGGIVPEQEAPAMAQAPTQMPQAPMQMAHGGIVHRQAGTPPTPSGGEMSLNEALRAAERRPGVFGRLGEMIFNADEATRNFLSRQMQTTGPTTASGKPIPFVDKFGRFYQPVGGTNPNMPSRGFPMSSKFNLGRFATRFGGPVGVAGGAAAYGLIESDPSRGQLYGSIFDLETGAGAEDRPGFTNLPKRNEYSYIDSSTVAPEEYIDSSTVVPEPRTTVPVPVPVPPAAKTEEPAPEPEPKIKTYDERVQDRLGVFTRYLGTDPEMRKAQALFLLAEAALNVAGAKGRSTGERLAVGLKGLPAGMAALGAEAEKERRSIAGAAISAVETDLQNAFKYNQQLAIQAAKNAPKTQEIIRSANYFMSRDGITQEMLQSNPEIAQRYIGFAQLINDKLLVRDPKTGDVVDPLGRPVPGFSKAAPTPANGIGYLDPSNPLVSVSNTYVTPATDEEKSGLIAQKGSNEQLIVQISSALDHLNRSVGLGASFRAGVTNIFAPITGDIGLGLTDLQTQNLRSKDRLLQDVLVKAKLRNPKAPVWEQQNIKKILSDPSSITQSWEEYLGVVNNVLTELMNENAMIDSRLNPGIPLKQISRMPTGTQTDPLMYGPNLDVSLESIFKNRPNARVWIERDVDGKREKFSIDGERFKQQLNQQRGQTQ